MYKLSIFIYQ